MQEMATPIILAWRIPWTGAWQATVHRVMSDKESDINEWKYYKQPNQKMIKKTWIHMFPKAHRWPKGTWKDAQYASGGQSIGVSASASVLPMNIQDWFPLGLTGWILHAVQGTLKNLLQHHSSKASILQRSAFFIVQLSHPYMMTGKTIALTRQTSVDKVMSLLFKILSNFVITFLPRSKCLSISWLQSPSAMILEP